MAPDTGPPRRPPPVGRRGLVLLALLVAGLAAAAALGDEGAAREGGGLALAGRFFGAAFRPDLGGETLRETLGATGRTVVFAAAAMSLALVLGIGLGFFTTTAWWRGDPVGGRSFIGRVVRRTVLPVVHGFARVVATLLRSIHELMWALLFNAAIGLDDMAAVLALALPFGGTLAKVFGEMVDEAPTDSARALQGAGASSLQVFVFGLLPRALPDMGAYAFYRFECALRSSAVLGFFGILTLGYAIRESFDTGHYGTVWTYLYATFLLVLLIDVWSGRLRRRAVA